MECPYCKKRMSLGYIPNVKQPVQWIPEGKKASVFSFCIAEYGIPLVNTFSILKANGYRAKAYFCVDCGVVIAPTEKSIN